MISQSLYYIASVSNIIFVMTFTVQNICITTHPTPQKKALDIPELPCDPAGTRTQGPNIKSVVLYQLSYEISLSNQ